MTRRSGVGVLIPTKTSLEVLTTHPSHFRF